MKSRTSSYVPDTIEEEEWGKVRLGYLSDADGRIWKDAFHFPDKRRSASFNRHKEPLWRRQVLESRAALVSREVAYYAHRREIVVKAASRAKSIGRTQRMLNYIEKPREDDGEITKPIMHDEFGRSLKPGEWRNTLKDWGLLSNEQNRVRKPSDKGIEQRLDDIGPERDLHYVQAHHLVVSIDVREDDPDDIYQRLNEAVYIAIDDVFTQHGFRVLWAIHADTPDHPHVHMIVKAQPHRGRRLRFDKQGDYLHYLRLVFAKSLSDCGLSCQATRRVDRSDLRRHILQGDSPLSDDKPWRRNGPSSPKLSECAPNWWNYMQWDQRKKEDDARRRAHIKKPGLLLRGKEYVQQWRRQKKLSHAYQSYLDRQPAYYHRMISSAEMIYINPNQAVENLLGFCMDGENNFPMARWLIQKAPVQFGQLRDDWHLQHEAQQQLQSEVNQIGDTLRGLQVKRVPKNEIHNPIIIYEKNKKRVMYQRCAVAHNLLRLAAYCRDVFKDNRLAYGIRWELTDSMRTAGPATLPNSNKTPVPSSMPEYSDKRPQSDVDSTTPSSSIQPETRDATIKKVPETPSPSRRRRRGYER